MADLIENIVVDTNIVISALIKDSLTRELIFKTKKNLLLPEVVFLEIKENEKEIFEKSGLNRQSYKKLVTKLLSRMRIVPTVFVEKHREEAIQIISHIDKDDVVFIANALAFENCAIWSDDKHFKKQSRVKVFTTSELFVSSA